MNTQFKSKFLQHLAKKKTNKGFTLIELLVVVIIIGVLAAIALPNLLGQVAKGRQAEAKNNLGAINRAQQGYRLEKARFGKLKPAANEEGVPVALQEQYYTFTDDGNPSVTTAAFNAASKADYTNDIKDYTASVGQTATGAFSQIICEADKPDQASVGGSTNGTTCGSNTKAVN